MPATTPEINKMIATLPSREELTPELRKLEDVAALNDYALRNPDKVFNDNFKEQRKHLTEETWKAVIQANPDMLDSASDKWRKIPNSNIVNKYQGQAFSEEVRKAINEDGVKLAGLAAAVPGTIIGDITLALPILSLMVYQPGTFLAETVGGTIGGLAGGAATDAITRGVSDYNSFADMIASNSTIPELYAEMLNPGILLGGLAGGVGGNVLYNNVIKPSAKKTITGYLAARAFNKSINENLGRLKFQDSNLLKIPLVENYLYHKTPGLLFNRDGSLSWPSIGQLNIKDGKYVSARKPHRNNPDKIWWDSSGHNTGTEVYVKPKENELNVLENITEIDYSHGVFHKDYYISDPVNVDKVIKYKKDPITNQYNISVPGKIVTNKTLDPSNLDYVEFNHPSNASTSLKFYYNDKMLPELEKLGLLPNTHLQGDDAVLMFKEYLNDIGDISLKESINVDLLKRYIPEVRERYGLVGNNNITDDEILKALYHHTKELGKGTAAVNVDGEPLLLFRGSTSRHDKLIPKGTSELLVSGADNILGNLFLGELPGTVQGGDHGIARYLGLNHGWLGPMPPQTRAAEVILPESKILDKDMYTLYTSEKFGDVKKLPGYALNTGYNDINAFIVRTPNVRDATEEIVVINPFNTIPEHKRLGQNHGEHYRALIKDAESKNQGLIHSKPVIEIGPSGEGIGKFRDEHEYYNYFALPNFNIQNAKHILPYDLRIPRNWEDPIIYRKQGGTINYLNLFK